MLDVAKSSLFQPCHSKAIKERHHDPFNFAQSAAVAAAANPARASIEDELDAFKMMAPLGQMAEMVDVSESDGLL